MGSQGRKDRLSHWNDPEKSSCDYFINNSISPVLWRQFPGEQGIPYPKKCLFSVWQERDTFSRPWKQRLFLHPGCTMPYREVFFHPILRKKLSFPWHSVLSYFLGIESLDLAWMRPGGVRRASKSSWSNILFFQCPVVCVNVPCLFLLSHCNSRVEYWLQQNGIWPAKLKRFIRWPFKEKFANPWLRARALETSKVLRLTGSCASLCKLLIFRDVNWGWK